MFKLIKSSAAIWLAMTIAFIVVWVGKGADCRRVAIVASRQGSGIPVAVIDRGIADLPLVRHNSPPDRAYSSGKRNKGRCGHLRGQYRYGNRRHIEENLKPLRIGIGLDGALAQGSDNCDQHCRARIFRPFAAIVSK